MRNNHPIRVYVDSTTGEKYTLIYSTESHDCSPNVTICNINTGEARTMSQDQFRVQYKEVFQNVYSNIRNP